MQHREERFLQQAIKSLLNNEGCLFGTKADAFLLPHEVECGPVIRIAHGPISELYVRFPSEDHLRDQLWQLCRHLRGEIQLEREVVKHLAPQFEAIMGCSANSLRPEHCHSPASLPIPSPILRVLGKTHRYTGSGEDASFDRLYIRERMRSILERMGSFVSEVFVRVPCTILLQKLQLAVSGSDL